MLFAVVSEPVYAELIDMIEFPISVGMLTVILHSDQIASDPHDMCALLRFIAFVNMFVSFVDILLCYLHLDYNCTACMDDRIVTELV